MDRIRSVISRVAESFGSGLSLDVVYLLTLARGFRRGVCGTLVAGATVLSAMIFLTASAIPQELKFPQIITIHYQAKDPRNGGQFIIWVEREKIFYGLDSKLFPAAKSVDVTYITPAPGTTTLTLIAVVGLNSTAPDYFHLSGNVRFKVSGMSISSSNIPPPFSP